MHASWLPAGRQPTPPTEATPQSGCSVAPGISRTASASRITMSSTCRPKNGNATNSAIARVDVMNPERVRHRFLEVVALTCETGGPLDLTWSLDMLPNDSGELGEVVTMAASQRSDVADFSETFRGVLPDGFQQPIHACRDQCRRPRRDGGLQDSRAVQTHRRVRSDRRCIPPRRLRACSLH